MQTILDNILVGKFDYKDFKDKKFLGRGEADVYKSYSKRLKSVVALKKFVHSFQSEEAKYLIKLSDSENVVKLHGLLYEGRECIGYVMEYMECGSLDDAIHNKGMFEKKGLLYGEDRVLVWMHHVACGIQRLHEAGIIHRDIKPQNILLGKSLDDVKISDFGLARNVPGPTLVTGGCGTYLYMAPEILKSYISGEKTSRYNKPCDIFAFAITCWEMIERRSPDRSAAHFQDLIDKRPKFEYTVMSYGYPLKEWIQTAWDGNPQKRPKIEKFLEEIRVLSSLESTKVCTESIINRLKVFFSRMEKEDFEKEMQKFKTYLENHRAYYNRNKHYYERAGVLQDHFDWMRNANYYDETQKGKFSLHIFAPPGFSDRSRRSIENAMNKHSYYDGFYQLTVEGGDCFMACIRYSAGLSDYNLEICEEISKMSYPGRGADSFPTVEEERQLYPIPIRNIVLVGTFPYTWNLSKFLDICGSCENFDVVSRGERYKFFVIMGHAVEDAFKKWRKDKEMSKEFHLLCVTWWTEEKPQHHISTLFEAYFKRYKKYCKNEENLALLEFQGEEDMQLAVIETSKTGPKRIVKIDDRYSEEKKYHDIVGRLMNAARNAPVVHLEQCSETD